MKLGTRVETIPDIMRQVHVSAAAGTGGADRILSGRACSLQKEVGNHISFLLFPTVGLCGAQMEWLDTTEEPAAGRTRKRMTEQELVQLWAEMKARYP